MVGQLFGRCGTNGTASKTSKSDLFGVPLLPQPLVAVVVCPCATWGQVLSRDSFWEQTVPGPLTSYHVRRTSWLLEGLIGLEGACSAAAFLGDKCRPLSQYGG